MLRLHGFASSNYYNVVKLALLEKALPFEEVLVYIGASESERPEYLTKSPLGKIPALETSQGFLSESRCILDYLQEVYPTPALVPSEPFARAKVRELATIVEHYFELTARPLIPHMFARREAHPALAKEVRGTLAKALRGLGRLTTFATYAAGDTFGEADLACIVHLPLVRLITKQVLKDDPLASLPGFDAYLTRMSARPTVQRLRADREADQAGFAAHVRALYGVPGAA